MQRFGTPRARSTTLPSVTMSARVAPMEEQAPAPAMLVPLDGDQRLALGLDLRADEVRCVALRQDGSIVAPAVTHRLENVALLGAVAALANAARAYVADVGRAWADVCLLYTSPSPRDKRQSRMPSSA